VSKYPLLYPSGWVGKVRSTGGHRRVSQKHRPVFEMLAVVALKPPGVFQEEFIIETVFNHNVVWESSTLYLPLRI
jgi:hypothetical protein